MKPTAVDEEGAKHTKWCGDGGKTALYAGYRVGKDDPLIEAIGSVDELNSFVGLSRSTIKEKMLNAKDSHTISAYETVNDTLLKIQKDLFVMGSDLANPREAMKKGPRITEERVGWLEKITLDLDKELPQLHNFILPGASAPSALMHVCRSVTRRVERRIIATKKKNIENITNYLNRLSYFFFLLSRDYNLEEGIKEDEWRGDNK
jgi:cob(I)alamin adenosyltransferase